MKAGISTASLYPQLLEDALRNLLDNGIKNTELFINTHSELDRSYIKELKNELDAHDAVCISLHPFTCPSEPMMLFSSYERRVDDMLDYYKYFFEAMNTLSADIFIFHGNMNKSAVDNELYFERYLKLYELGHSFGITVAQENVERCQSRSLDFLKSMKSALKEKAFFVLDVKQAVRSGEDPVIIASELGDSIVHVHMSDHSSTSDCMIPGQGSFDMKSFFKVLKEHSFDGAVLIELYRHNYSDLNELLGGLTYIENIINNTY